MAKRASMLYDMQIVKGIYLPSGDQHFAEQVRNGPLVDGKGTYQLNKLNAALECVAAKGRWRLAIDVGAHVGLWTRILALSFDKVIAVEPTQKHVECLLKNVQGCGEKVEIWQFPLADETKTLRLKNGTEVATTSVCLDNELEDFTLGAEPLDKFKLENVDFIKLDCEGFEYFVVEGGEETIRRCRPVIVVEQKKKRIARYGLDRKQPAVKLLQSWGMVEFWARAGDHCLGWEN